MVSRPLETVFCDLGLGLGLEVSVLNFFPRPPMYLPNPFHMVACLFLPVTQVTKFLASLSLDLSFRQPHVLCTRCVRTSHGGIFMWPQRARMSDSGLCNLVFAKRNAHFVRLTSTVAVIDLR